MFFGLIFLSIACSQKAIKNINWKEEVSCFVEIDKNIFTTEEEVSFFFVVWNTSNQEIFINNSPYGYYHHGVKKGGFDILVENEEGVVLKPTINRLFMPSGRYGRTKIDSNKSYKIRLNLADYVDLKEVGDYKIIIHKTLPIYLKRKRTLRKSEAKNYSKGIYLIKKTNVNISIVNPENSP